eukprot:7874692-Lingulodinium_polyedra.AAC.1
MQVRITQIPHNGLLPGGPEPAIDCTEGILVGKLQCFRPWVPRAMCSCRATARKAGRNGSWHA